MMYGVKDWNEEVIKWLAVATCMAMVGMAVVPVSVGDVVGGLYIAGVVNDKGATAAGLVAGGWTAIGSSIAMYYGSNVVLLGLTGVALGSAIVAGAGVGLL